MTSGGERRREARALIAERLGLQVPDARMVDLDRGIAATCEAGAIAASDDPLRWLSMLPDDSPEWRRLVGHLTVGETYFFRDRACFAALEAELLPGLIARRRAEGDLRLRIWSAGCATGEEPYSIAILLDRLLPDRARWALTILATDVNGEALDCAARGLYREWSFRDTPAAIRAAYFVARSGQTFQVHPRIREAVTFAPLNLAANVYPSVVTNTGAMDVILCRNVLMYLTPDTQRAVSARLCDALVSGGWLAVSPAEASPHLLHPLRQVDLSGALFYRKDGRPVDPADAPAANVWVERVTPHLVGRPTEDTEAPKLRHAAADVPPTLEGVRELADRGDLEQARSACEILLTGHRLDPHAHLLLAAICQEQEDTAGALAALRSAVYLAPDSPLAYFEIASLHLRHGQRRKGRQSMETAVRLAERLDPVTVVPGSSRLTAAELLEMARLSLESFHE